MSTLVLFLDNAIFPDQDSIQGALESLTATGDILSIQVPAEMDEAGWDHVAAAILESNKVITI